MKITHLRGDGVNGYIPAISIAIELQFNGEDEKYIRYAVAFQNKSDQFNKSVANRILTRNIESPLYYRVAKIPKYLTVTHDIIIYIALCDMVARGRVPNSKIKHLMESMQYYGQKVLKTIK